MRIFTSEERQLINLYQRPPEAEMQRAIRLSIQYLVGASRFLALAISNPSIRRKEHRG